MTATDGPHTHKLVGIFELKKKTSDDQVCTDGEDHFLFRPRTGM